MQTIYPYKGPPKPHDLECAGASISGITLMNNKDLINYIMPFYLAF